MPLILICSPTAEPKGKTVLARALPSTQTSRALSTSSVGQARPSSTSQLRAGKLPGVSPNNRHVGRGLGVAGRDLAAPEVAFDADAGGQRGLLLHRRPCEGDVLAPPVFLQSLESPNWTSGQRWMANVWPPSWLSPFRRALQHAHGGHHDDDGEHADQHAEQRERRAQLVRRERFMAMASFRGPRPAARCRDMFGAMLLMAQIRMTNDK